jgi:hypothetical protein
MILFPWDKDCCPNCAADVVPRWWKLYRESRICPACGGKVELSRISRSLRDGIGIGFASMVLLLLLAVAADPGWGSLALAMATIAAVAWILTWLPLAVSQRNVLQAPETISVPWPGHAITHVAAAAALSALAACFLIAAVAFEFRDQVLTLIVLGVGIGGSVALGLLFDLPLVATMSASDRWLDRWPWPRQPWLRRFLSGVVRLAIVAVLAFAFLKAVTLLG